MRTLSSRIFLTNQDFIFVAFLLVLCHNDDQIGKNKNNNEIFWDSIRIKVVINKIWFTVFPDQIIILTDFYCLSFLCCVCLLGLVERVFLRIGSAETDEQLESCLDRFLPPVLLKLNSSEEAVRKKVGKIVTLPGNR